MADFTTIENIWQMFSPSDLNGSQKINLGGPLDKVDDSTNPFTQLVGLLENNGRGVFSIDQMVNQINTIKTKDEFGKIDLSNYLAIWTPQGIVDLGAMSSDQKTIIDVKGQPKVVDSLQQIIGPDFRLGDLDASIIVSRSPFFNPSTRNTKRAEPFMNGLPTIIASQMIPFMQVEFQFTTSPWSHQSGPGLLKFLLGDASVSGDTTQAISDAHTRMGYDQKGLLAERDFAGMEMFTSPQTLVNPQPNLAVGPGGDRFTEVIDPFRPFATLQSVTISVSPSGAGYFVYKKANMSIKVHDRSRLSEISDLIRARLYGGVTIWMTYGWRAPVRGTDNPYFKYINDNMLMREAYHIVNTSFSFDNTGQVTINLELFTKGAAELRDLKIGTSSDSFEFKTAEIAQLIEDVKRYRKILKLDPPEGLNKEVRIYQILDAAESGTFPDLKANDALAAVDGLKKAYEKSGQIDDNVTKLITALQKLYAKDTKDQTKYTLKDKYETRVTETVNKMFRETRTGDDPFLYSKHLAAKHPEVAKLLQDAQKNAALPTGDKGLATFVSFGKLFTVFALRGILTGMTRSVDEVQVFFYNLNESCGPASSMSVAEFPIDMPQFLDQFNDLAKSHGGDKITLEDFLGLCINAQFLDNRAVAYGFREFYKPYKHGEEIAFGGKDSEQNFENKRAVYSKQWGAFKKPALEMYVECAHARITDAGQVDPLQTLAYSAADSANFKYKDVSGAQMKRILRIHIYDKQTNAYREASKLLASYTSEGNGNVVYAYADPPTDFAKEVTKDGTDLVTVLKNTATLVLDTVKGAGFLEFKNSNQAKYLIGMLMPTIRFGSNGSIITQANLSSKADPLLSTVNMMKTQTLKNSATPNGGGPGGIPLRVIPAQLQMSTMGMPLATAAQKYFIDFQTGTTLDNLYILTNYSHTFSPGKFETTWTFGFADGYGRFEGAVNVLDAASKQDSSVPKAPD